MPEIKKFLKKEAAAVISVIAAVISCFLVPVTNYGAYVDTEIISLLFCLMAVAAGLRRGNVFRKITGFVTRISGNSRRLAFLLVFSSFFSAMLITNDVALITFVPFTVMIYKELNRSPVYTIVLQTIAANLGSAFTPIGNPQNLYLFTLSEMSPGEFFGITAKPTAISIILLMICLIPIKPDKITEVKTHKVQLKNPRFLVIYGVLFILCILSVFGLVDNITLFASICIAAAILEPALFGEVDYGLLVTFAAFFIFVGNIKNIPAVTSFMQWVITGRETETAILLSQVISNVPAAVMLSGFTDDIRALILGVNIGGMGTIIASMASLISFKIYTGSKGADSRKYMLCFTLMNVLFLAVLYILCK